MNHFQPESGGWSPRGGFTFVNGVTGLNGGPSPNNFNAYASFLLGLPGSMGKAYQFYDPMQTRELDQGYFIRDNWQVNRKLSLNLGLRMEHFPIMDRGEFGIERYDLDTNKCWSGAVAMFRVPPEVTRLPSCGRRVSAWRIAPTRRRSFGPALGLLTTHIH